MKRLVSKEDEEKKRRRNQIVVGIVLAVLMILSTLGFALQSSRGNSENTGTNINNNITYNGLEFSYVNGLWVLGNFVFKYNPRQVQSINASGLKDATYYQGLPLHIYSENEDAETEIYVNMIQIAERVQEACPKGQLCEGNLPIKTCEDNFVIIKESNTSLIRQEDNCVYIEGKNEELVNLADEFLFKILGIR